MTFCDHISSVVQTPSIYPSTRPLTLLYISKTTDTIWTSFAEVVGVRLSFVVIGYFDKFAW